MKKVILSLLGISVILAIAYFLYMFVTAPVSSDSFTEVIDILSDPIQTSDKDTFLTPMEKGNIRFFFTVQAKYKLSGVLVSKKRYTNTHWSRISPYDYATCWGNVPTMFPYVKFRQYSRFCHYRYKLSAPIDINYLAHHMSNNHMIPSNPNIRKALRLGRKGQKVEIEGYLVNVMANMKKRGNTNWNTSIIRTDTGNGACEIIYVTKLRLEDKEFE